MAQMHEPLRDESGMYHRDISICPILPFRFPEGAGDYSMTGEQKPVALSRGDKEGIDKYIKAKNYPQRQEPLRN